MTEKSESIKLTRDAILYFQGLNVPIEDIIEEIKADYSTSFREAKTPAFLRAYSEAILIYLKKRVDECVREKTIDIKKLEHLAALSTFTFAYVIASVNPKSPNYRNLYDFMAAMK